MKKISWTHIIWDLYECNLNYFINKYSHKYLENFFKEKVSESWLNIIWSLIHTFENNSFSLVIMLSESHICIHTWPEKYYVSIDLFVCNYTKDNSKVAIKLFDEILEYFKSNEPKINIIER